MRKGIITLLIALFLLGGKSDLFVEAEELKATQNLKKTISSVDTDEKRCLAGYPVGYYHMGGVYEDLTKGDQVFRIVEPYKNLSVPTKFVATEKIDTILLSYQDDIDNFLRDNPDEKVVFKALPLYSDECDVVPETVYITIQYSDIDIFYTLHNSQEGYDIDYRSGYVYASK